MVLLQGGMWKLFGIMHVTKSDKPFWYTLDNHLSENEFDLKIRDKRGYVISNGNTPVGVMRYNFFWDIIPFLTFIHIDESSQRKGFGSRALQFWEKEMRELGFKMVMTSTQVDEQAQHFYRKLGYKERGALFLDNMPYEQTQEMFMLKVL